MPIFRMSTAGLVLGAVFVAAASMADTAEADEWQRRDNNLHLVTGIVIGSAVTAYTKSPAKGVLAGVTVGVLKEIYDRGASEHRGSVPDAIATAMGAIAGSYVTGLIIAPGSVSYR